MKRLVVVGVVVLALVGVGLRVLLAGGNDAPKRLPDLVATMPASTSTMLARDWLPRSGRRSWGSDVVAKETWGIDRDRAKDATSDQVTFGTFLPPTKGVGMVAKPTLGYVVKFANVCWHSETAFAPPAKCFWGPMYVYVDAITGHILGTST